MNLILILFIKKVHKYFLFFILSHRLFSQQVKS